MCITRNLRIRKELSNPYTANQLRCTIDNCTRLCKSKSGLTKHIRACHSQHHVPVRPPTPDPIPAFTPSPERTQFQCSVAGCGDSFRTRARLTWHVRRSHQHSERSDSLRPTSPAPAESHSLVGAQSSHNASSGNASFAQSDVIPEQHFHADTDEGPSNGAWVAPSHRHSPTSPTSSRTGTHEGIDHDDVIDADYHREEPLDVIMAPLSPAPHHSSPAHHQMEWDNEVHLYDDATHRTSDSASPQTSSQASSPGWDHWQQDMSFHPPDNHYFPQSDDLDDDNDYDSSSSGSDDTTAAEGGDRSPPSDPLKRTYHPLINGLLTFWIYQPIHELNFY